MKLENFLMSSETQEKLRKQTNFISHLIPGELYPAREVQCCLEYLNVEKNSKRTINVFSDEHGNKYFFLKLKGGKNEFLKYENIALRK